MNRIHVAYWLSLVGLLIGLPPLPGAEPLKLPPTERKAVVDEYHGIPIADDYRWLEDGDAPAVRAWCDTQNAATRGVLDALPSRAHFARRLRALHAAASPDHSALAFSGGVLFALKFAPPKNQPFLVTLKSADDPASAKIVCDPNTLDEQGATAIDFYVPSHDARWAAVCLSKKGSEQGDVTVYEVATGRALPDVVPRVNYPTAGGSVAWNGDSSGFYYTRYPRGEERPPEDINFYQQIYFHQLGTPTGEDRHIYGDKFPRIAEIDLKSTDDGRYLLATVANGDGGEYAHFLMSPGGAWSQITTFADKATLARFGHDGWLYLLSRNTPGHRDAIVRIRLDQPQLAQAEPVYPELEAVIQNFAVGQDQLVGTALVGGPSELWAYDLAAKKPVACSSPAITAIAQIVHLQHAEFLYRQQSYITPAGWKRLTFADGRGTTAETALVGKSPADFSDVEVVRDFATSKDGTRVPLNIIRRKGLELNGNNPTILYGYGGYGHSLSPAFQASRKVWLEQGGVFAIANLRGGGEFGEKWHLAGNLTRKQNVFDDFEACARRLIDSGYTRPQKLAIQGGSNGGLLMGAALTQHPELFQAVVAHVGIYDMLRVELHPNGAFNIPEFGSVKVRDQFDALLAYSPYHHVRDVTAYPAVLLLTGHNDGRVDPYHSRKMTARLQATTTSGLPVLLRYNYDSGHGIGAGLAERVAQEADVYAFLAQQLNMNITTGP